MKGFESCRTSVMMMMGIGESWSEKHQLWLINKAACGGGRWFLRSRKRTESPLFFSPARFFRYRSTERMGMER